MYAQLISAGSDVFSLVVGDATDPEITVPVSLVHKVDVDPAPMDEDDFFDAPGTNNDISQSPTVPIQAHFTTAPTVSKPLSLVDWSTESASSEPPLFKLG